MENDTVMSAEDINILDELSCSINLKEYHSLTADELEANILEECPSKMQASVFSFHSAKEEPLDFDGTVPSDCMPVDKSLLGQSSAQTSAKGTAGDGQIKTKGHQTEENSAENDQGVIKLEFSCESEKVVENDCHMDFDIDDDDDDDFFGNSDFSGMDMQVEEVYETSTAARWKEGALGSLSPAVEDQDGASGDNVPTAEEELDEHEMSYVMSEHNYTSQELVTTAASKPAMASTATGGSDEISSDERLALRQSLISLIQKPLTQAASEISLATISGMDLKPKSNNNGSDNENDPSEGSLSTNISTKIKTFVDDLMERISSFRADEDGESIKQEPPAESDQQQEGYDEEKRDLFVQDIIDAVLAEDAAECAALDREETSSMVDSVNCKSAERLPKVEKQEEDVEALEKKVEDVAVGETTKDTAVNRLGGDSLEGEPLSSPLKATQESDQEHDSGCSARERVDSSEDGGLLSENCSEPLEHAVGLPTDMFLNELLMRSPHPDAAALDMDMGLLPPMPPLLAQLMQFANTLQHDCQSFQAATTNIEPKLQLYLRRQLDKFKELVLVQPVDREVQTDPPPAKATSTAAEMRHSRHKLRKLNSQNKRALLRGSNDSLSALSTSESDGEVELPEAEAMQQELLEERTEVSTLLPSQKEEATTSVVTAVKHETAATAIECDDAYDDGVSLDKYVQSEIFGSLAGSYPSSAPDLNGSSRDPSTSAGADAALPGEEAHGSGDAAGEGTASGGESANESDKENDREIQRLININGLGKRSAQSALATGKAASGAADEKTAKTKAKPKTKNDLIDFLDEELDRCGAAAGSSEESGNESEEEITEQTFLKRYNENLKQQLLHSSSSDSEDMESDGAGGRGGGGDDDVDEDDRYFGGKDSVGGAATEEGKASPLLDKFLKSFDADVEMEDADGEDAEVDDDVAAEADGEETEDNDEMAAVEAGVSGGGAGQPKAERQSDESMAISKKKTSDVSLALDDATKKLDDGAESSLDNSDCEVLNGADGDLFSARVRSRSDSATKPKRTLEKLIKDADKRKKVAQLDDDLISLSSESESSDDEAGDGEATEEAAKTARLIKPMLRPDQLARETRKAQKNEEDRLRRLEKKQNQLSKALKEHKELLKKEDLVLDFIEETKTFIKVHPDIVKHLKQHQVDGLRFLYNTCYGGVEALKKQSGSGCILAHCMGLGKTLQLIALLHTVVSYKQLKTSKVLVLCPKSTVMNWADEIKRWIWPLHPRNLKVFTFKDICDINEKLSVLKEWSQSTSQRAGCLLMGYEAFRTLVFYHSYKKRGNVSTEVLEDIRDKVVKYLLKPGADLVVCDEGHIIKNSKSAISLAVTQVVTPKRIVLTGTPIQNNLKEYYSMVNFIKPLFLGTEKEFANLYANPIKNGQHKDSGKHDIKIMKQRSFVLHKKLSKFVQRKEAELLKSFLPPKYEYVLFIPMTTVQNNLYEHILSAIVSRRDDNRGRGLITDYTCLRKIWTHPKVLEDAWKNAIQQKDKREVRRNPSHSDDDQPDDIYDSRTGVMSVTNDWWRALVTTHDLESILPSNKLRTMFEILRMCSEKNEKCLIFSAFVAVLNVVEYFFRKITKNDYETLKEFNILNPLNNANFRARNTWVPNKDYYRLDGKTPKALRHEMIQQFNSKENARSRVFLISSKAGGQGINLIGANRVIILDTSWNPSNDQQNIFRIFRLGQKRNCYIYRLLAMGTMEEKVYSRSVTKQAMSFRVVDEQQIDRHYSMAELAELYSLTIPDYSQREVPVLPQDPILASLLRNYPDLVYKYHEHDSLLENKVEQELSEQDKADAWAAYERDLQMNSEIREQPNLEELQNNLAAQAKMPNYLGTFPGPDMQSLLNYGGLGPPPASAAAQFYNPYSTPNQQYMELYNMYRKYTQSYTSYSDVNKALRDCVFNPAALFRPNTGGPPPGAPPMMGGAGGMGNPLSALGDLSLFNMGMPKSLPPMPPQHGGPPKGVPGGPPGLGGVSSLAQHSPLPAHLAGGNSSLGGLGGGVGGRPSATPFGPYTPALDNMFQSLYNFPGDFGSTSSSAVAAMAAAAASKNKFTNPPPSASPRGPPSPYLPAGQPPPPPHYSPTKPSGLSGGGGVGATSGGSLVGGGEVLGGLGGSRTEAPLPYHKQPTQAPTKAAPPPPPTSSSLPLIGNVSGGVPFPPPPSSAAPAPAPAGKASGADSTPLRRTEAPPPPPPAAAPTVGSKSLAAPTATVALPPKPPVASGLNRNGPPDAKATPTLGRPPGSSSAAAATAGAAAGPNKMFSMMPGVKSALGGATITKLGAGGQKAGKTASATITPPPIASLTKTAHSGRPSPLASSSSVPVTASVGGGGGAKSGGPAASAAAADPSKTAAKLVMQKRSVGGGAAIASASRNNSPSPANPSVAATSSSATAALLKKLPAAEGASKMSAAAQKAKAGSLATATSSPASLNMGIVYPATTAGSPTASASASVTKRLASDMQILAASSTAGGPPKQLGDVAPNISLTAVRGGGGTATSINGGGPASGANNRNSRGGGGGASRVYGRPVPTPAPPHKLGGGVGVKRIGAPTVTTASGAATKSLAEVAATAATTPAGRKPAPPHAGVNGSAKTTPYGGGGGGAGSSLSATIKEATALAVLAKSNQGTLQQQQQQQQPKTTVVSLPAGGAALAAYKKTAVKRAGGALTAVPSRLWSSPALQAGATSSSSSPSPTSTSGGRSQSPSMVITPSNKRPITPGAGSGLRILPTKSGSSSTATTGSTATYMGQSFPSQLLKRGVTMAQLATSAAATTAPSALKKAKSGNALNIRTIDISQLRNTAASAAASSAGSTGAAGRGASLGFMGGPAKGGGGGGGMSVSALPAAAGGSLALAKRRANNDDAVVVVEPKRAKLAKVPAAVVRRSNVN